MLFEIVCGKAGFVFVVSVFDVLNEYSLVIVGLLLVFVERDFQYFLKLSDAGAADMD